MSKGSAGLFATIRARCETLARRAESVRIDDAGLEAFADRLAAGPWTQGDLDPGHDFRGDPASSLAFVIELDAINFGSGWFPLLSKRAGCSGYRTIAAAFREACERDGVPDAATLRDSRAAQVARLLEQDPEDAQVRPLMELYAQAWRELGSWLGERHADRFESVVEEAGGSAERLVTSLAEMPMYRDVARYDELEVPFYKRAQITVADLHRAFPDRDWGRFEDLDALTLFADNLVPHVLRCDGVLAYTSALAARIDAHALLEAGSREETEIRGVAVVAVERLVAALAARGRPTTAHALDELLWNAGQSPEIKARPRHRARSTYY